MCAGRKKTPNTSCHATLEERGGQIFISRSNCLKHSETKSLRSCTVQFVPGADCVTKCALLFFNCQKVFRAKNKVRKTPHGRVIRHSVLFRTQRQTNTQRRAQTHLLPWVYNTAFCGWITLHCHSRLVYITRPPHGWFQGPLTSHGPQRGDASLLFSSSAAV